MWINVPYPDVLLWGAWLRVGYAAGASVPQSWLREPGPGSRVITLPAAKESVISVIQRLPAR